MYRVQIIDHDPSKMHLFYRDLRDVGLLFFQPIFWWMVDRPVVLLLRQPCLGEITLPPVGRGCIH